MSDSEYYKRLKEDPPKRKEKPKHKGNWSLVLWVGGKVQVILSDKPYAMCVHKKKMIEREPRCRTGQLKIVPFSHKNNTR